MHTSMLNLFIYPICQITGWHQIAYDATQQRMWLLFLSMMKTDSVVWLASSKVTCNMVQNTVGGKRFMRILRNVGLMNHLGLGKQRILLDGDISNF